MKTAVTPLQQVFVSIPDPRSRRQVRHDLAELLTVAVCAVLCGADEFTSIEAWGKEKLDWLRGFMQLEHGIPSHDTFERVFAMLDAHHFEAAFRRWVGMVIPALKADAETDTIIGVDGKASRRTTSKLKSKPLHLVSAFVAGLGIVLGQRATAEKSNEITAIPELLMTLAIDGCVVTIDAMGTQTAIARTIVSRGADYVLCVKDNQPKLSESIMLARAGVGEPLPEPSYFEQTTKAHGRIELRRCWAYDCIDRLSKPEQWEGLRSFAIVERLRKVGERTSHECRYYISSLPADAARIAHAVRSHWEIENRLHWCLDVQLNEDQSRVRTGYAANNFAIVRHITMNLIRLNATRKGSIKTKRLLAASSDQFRAELLGLMT
ncbi:ISAs1 family transposase [Denitromonas ohlonensis]|uniref:ISAs1 family transposase n=2 Tax=Denitromonas TaxID=139331 RepID=A0A557SFC7_9RHOO|nr:ISAs1 family transposase [Denitromonas ohlonensis]TVT46743.1 MAG: ISAs1 family transposase [Denitromonas halophila]TVO64217.1 ISAs1 family transposase [Denitromonas ohlonensis]TVO76118.1 ISAs1 family transposase [Denitromonas ohlonensis]TVT66368.1 MAG: ISAs1 family transposase [Denitromonas halophila]TVT77505.1 MAG: ISAs1 family transposase [Denitromonas halophila]